MAGNALGSGCGCAFALLVLAVGVGAVTVWAFLVETRLIYWLAAGLMGWVMLMVVRSIGRCRGGGRRGSGSND
jgi:hypothetical protein